MVQVREVRRGGERWKVTIMLMAPDAPTNTQKIAGDAPGEHNINGEKNRYIAT